MADVPSCNPWLANTVRFSDQVAACKERSALASANELPDVTFLLTLLDVFQRLAVKGTAGFSNLSAYDRCAAEKNASNAYVQLRELSSPVQANTTELKQMVLWQAGQALCALNA